MSLFLAAASGSAANAWDPLSISGIRAFWNANETNTVVGGKYSQIDDLTGNGINYAQATAGIRPVQSAADALWNNANVAAFTGTEEMTTALNVGAMTTGSWTVFLTVSFTGAGAYMPAFDCSAGPPNNVIYRGAGPNLFVSNSAAVDTNYVVDANPHLIIAIFNAVTVKYDTYVDGIQVNSSGAVVSDPWAATKAELGRDRGPFGWLIGKFGAGGIVDGIMSAPDIALTTTWSQTTFGTP